MTWILSLILHMIPTAPGLCMNTARHYSKIKTKTRLCKASDINPHFGIVYISDSQSGMSNYFLSSQESDTHKHTHFPLTIPLSLSLSLSCFDIFFKSTNLSSLSPYIANQSNDVCLFVCFSDVQCSVPVSMTYGTGGQAAVRESHAALYTF